MVVFWKNLGARLKTFADLDDCHVFFLNHTIQSAKSYVLQFSTATGSPLKTLVEIFDSHLLLAIFPDGQPFISGVGYIGAAWGCCIMGFCVGPILWAIMELGGLDTLLKAGSGCWVIPYKINKITVWWLWHLAIFCWRHMCPLIFTEFHSCGCTISLIWFNLKSPEACTFEAWYKWKARRE